jgi:hypothetical protein
MLVMTLLLNAADFGRIRQICEKKKKKKRKNYKNKKKKQ